MRAKRLRRRARKGIRRIGSAIAGAWDRWPDVVDRAIYTVAPGLGARRMAIRNRWRLAKQREQILNAAWKGAENDRLYGDRWLRSQLSPDSELEQDMADLRENCETLYRNNTIAHGAVEGRISNEVGTGILPQGRCTETDGAHTKDECKAINRQLEDVARRWSECGVDRTGLHSLTQVERLVDRNYAIYGEAFVALADRGGADKPIPLVMDVIHPFRVETPPEQEGNENVRLGIRYDDAGQVLGYYVRRSHPYDTKDADLDYDYIPRFDANGQPRMLHIFDPMFPGQSRGWPWMAAAVNRLKDAEDVVEFTIISMQVEACFTAFIKPGENGPTPHERARATSSETDSSGNRLEEVRPGAVEYLNAGEEVEFGNPQRPGSQFLPMIEFTLRSIAACINYPYELLANNFFRTTFSSGRLAMMAGRMGFNMRRQTLIEKLLCPLWKRIVFESILVGELDGLADLSVYQSRPYVYERHIWQAKRGVIHINPEQEVKAHALELANDTNTLADIYGEGGLDWEDRLQQRFAERSEQIRHDVELAGLRRRLEEAAGLEPGASLGDEQPTPTTAEQTEPEEVDAAT